jgi:hypothetical protein
VRWTGPPLPPTARRLASGSWQGAGAGALAGEGLRSYADGEPVAPLPTTGVCGPGALAVVGTGR